MNDDYLWDRTGEPDPDVQELEEVLGTLRYQVQPLELPAGMRPDRERRPLPRLAIAAAIALMILAVGLWLRVNRSHNSPPGVTAKGRSPAAGERNEQAVISTSPTPSPVNQQVADYPEKVTPRETPNLRHRKALSPGNTSAKNRNRRPSSVAPPGEMSNAELDEARAAKEQLMVALRLASAKLNFAQRKTQGPPTPSTIRNQHKVG